MICHNTTFNVCLFVCLYVDLLVEDNLGLENCLIYARMKCERSKPQRKKEREKRRRDLYFHIENGKWKNYSVLTSKSCFFSSLDFQFQLLFGFSRLFEYLQKLLVGRFGSRLSSFTFFRFFQ